MNRILCKKNRIRHGRVPRVFIAIIMTYLKFVMLILLTLARTDSEYSIILLI